MELVEARSGVRLQARTLSQMSMGSDEDSVGKKNGSPSVFVGNLDPEVSAGTVQSLFAAIGEIRSCSIGRKSNKAFATVHLLSAEAVQAAVDTLSGTQFNGRILHVEPYNKRKKQEGKEVPEAKSLMLPKKEIRGTQIRMGEVAAAAIRFAESRIQYPVRVGNLPSTATRTKLRALFVPFGEVKKLKLNQGRGVVWFDQLAKAASAAASLKGTVFEGQLLSFEARLPKSVVPMPLSVLTQHSHAADPARCGLIALYASSAEKLLKEVFQAQQQIMDAAIALHIPVITAHLLSENITSESIPHNASFINIPTFDVTRDVAVRRAIVDSKRTITVIVGVETDIGVLQTTLGLLEMGHTVFVVADAIATSEAKAASFALDRIRSAGARITTKRGLLHEWAGTVQKAEELKRLR